MAVLFSKQIDRNSTIRKSILRVYWVREIMRLLNITSSGARLWTVLDYLYYEMLICFSISYENLTGIIFQELDNASKLQIIIDCSVLINHEKSSKRNIRIQDLSELEFHARRLTHALQINRYKLLDRDTS